MVDEFEYNVNAYLDNARTNSKAQYKAASAADKWHYVLGVMAVVVGTVVSTSIFGTLATSPAVGWRIVAGLLTLLASVLAAMQTFLNFASRATLHRTAGAQYGDVRRRCEETLVRYHLLTDRADKVAFADGHYRPLLDRLTDRAASSPELADKYWKRAREDNEKRDKEAKKQGTNQYARGIPDGRSESVAPLRWLAIALAMNAASRAPRVRMVARWRTSSSSEHPPRA
jgi:hypothetical protein